MVLHISPSLLDEYLGLLDPENQWCTIESFERKVRGIWDKPKTAAQFGGAVSFFLEHGGEHEDIAYQEGEQFYFGTTESKQLSIETSNQDAQEIPEHWRRPGVYRVPFHNWIKDENGKLKNAILSYVQIVEPMAKVLLEWWARNPGFYETRVVQYYEIPGHTIAMTMRRDFLDMQRIVDFKTFQQPRYFKYDKYKESYQWRCYLDSAPGINEFEYHGYYYNLKKEWAEWVEPLRYTAYHGLRDDVVNTLGGCVRFMERNNLLEHLRKSEEKSVQLFD